MPGAGRHPNDARRLLGIRLLHSLAWAIFAGAILVIPVATMNRQFVLAAWLSLLVWGEVALLALNGLRCPLTAMAARYTDDRRANFDICLPEWLARHNKTIFGALFAIVEVQLWWRWRA